MESYIFTLSCPATASQQIDSVTSETIAAVQSFISYLQNENKLFSEATDILHPELILLKKFLYRLSTVFRNDKSIKVLKLISKTITKFNNLNMRKLVQNLQDQHSIINGSTKVYVSPKPKYEHLLTRLLCAGTLIAQILCYCQHLGHLLTPRIHLGHFISKNVLALSLTSRIWVVSLHLFHLLVKMYDGVHQMYRSDILPKCAVEYLPKDFKMPVNLHQRIIDDSSFKDIHHMLTRLHDGCFPFLPEIMEKTEENRYLSEVPRKVELGSKLCGNNTPQPASKLPSVASTIEEGKPKKISKLDREFDDLMELKALAMKPLKPLTSAGIEMNNMRPSFDVGELVSRKEELPSTNKNSKKRANRWSKKT